MVNKKPTNKTNKQGIKRLDNRNAPVGGNMKIEKDHKKSQTSNKRKVGRSVTKPQDKKKFKPRTFDKPVSAFGKNVYQYVSRLFNIQDGITSPIKTQLAVTLADALKEVKLIDKAIKRVKFKSQDQQGRINSLKTLNDLHLRKRGILSCIASINTSNNITVTIGGTPTSMSLFTARVHIKEMKEYVKKFKDSRLKIGEDGVENIIREIESSIIEIESKLHDVSKQITIVIPG